MDSEARLRLIAKVANLTIDAPIPLPSDSNEVWKIGELVVQICHWSTDHTRLQREALILEHMPDEVLHVRLADAGVIDNMSWTLTYWVPGTMLSTCWADLDRTQQRTAAEQLGHALRTLHAWEPSPEVRATLAARPTQPDYDDVIGADLNPLPVDRALRLVEPAMRLENVDRQLVEQLGEQLKRLRHLDPLMVPTSGTVVHGDAHLNNVIWNGVRVAALLDFEWARLGPPDLELQSPPRLPRRGAPVAHQPLSRHRRRRPGRRSTLALRPERDAARPPRQGTAAGNRRPPTVASEAAASDCSWGTWLHRGAAQWDPSYFEAIQGAPPGTSEARSLFTALPDGSSYDDKFLLATVDATTKALVGLVDVIRDHPKPATATLGTIFVHPATPRRGVAIRAVDQFEATLRADGCHQLEGRCLDESPRRGGVIVAIRRQP